jgi:hypothetical protein
VEDGWKKMRNGEGRRKRSMEKEIYSREGRNGKKQLRWKSESESGRTRKSMKVRKVRKQKKIELAQRIWRGAETLE